MPEKEKHFREAQVDIAQFYPHLRHFVNAVRHFRAIICGFAPLNTKNPVRQKAVESSEKKISRHDPFPSLSTMAISSIRTVQSNSVGSIRIAYPADLESRNAFNCTERVLSPFYAAKFRKPAPEST
jgi:hypothetical protein